MSENALIQKIKPTVAASPHMKSGETSQTMMRDVIIALIPSALVAILFFGLNAEKRLKIWTNLCFIMICGRCKRYQTESTKINKSTQNLHSKNAPPVNHKPEGRFVYSLLAVFLSAQRRKRRLACHAVNRQTGAVLEFSDRRLGACAKVTGEAAGIKAGADQESLQRPRDIALPAGADIKHRRLGTRSEYPVHHQTGASLTI